MIASVTVASAEPVNLDLNFVARSERIVLSIRAADATADYHWTVSHLLLQADL